MVVFFFLDSDLVVSQSLLILPEELIALARIHVVLGEICVLVIVRGLVGAAFCANRGRKVVKRSFVLGKVHVAESAIHEGLCHVCRVK